MTRKEFDTALRAWFGLRKVTRGEWRGTWTGTCPHCGDPAGLYADRTEGRLGFWAPGHCGCNHLAFLTETLDAFCATHKLGRK